LQDDSASQEAAALQVLESLQGSPVKGGSVSAPSDSLDNLPAAAGVSSGTAAGSLPEDRQSFEVKRRAPTILVNTRTSSPAPTNSVGSRSVAEDAAKEREPRINPNLYCVQGFHLRMQANFRKYSRGELSDADLRRDNEECLMTAKRMMRIYRTVRERQRPAGLPRDSGFAMPKSVPVGDQMLHSFDDLCKAGSFSTGLVYTVQIDEVVLSFIPDSGFLEFKRCVLLRAGRRRLIHSR
jgi:hypothetical protein